MSYEVTRNDMAFLQYMRTLADQIEREEEPYTAQLQQWLDQAIQNGPARTITLAAPGTITASTTNQVGAQTHSFPPTFPKQVDRKDIEVMLAWARGEDVLVHVLERE
jgi:hypothetical protein